MPGQDRIFQRVTQQYQDEYTGAYFKLTSLDHLLIYLNKVNLKLYVISQSKSFLYFSAKILLKNCILILNHFISRSM